MERLGELVEEVVAVGELTLSLLRPPDPEALLDEEAFEREEFLPYWAELWPSGLALARRVAKREIVGRNVLELGCGLGVPSLTAALGGARVLATDWAPDAVELLRENATRNGAALEVAIVDWVRPGRIVGRTWDLVLAADVLYERRNVEPLLRLLSRLRTREILLAEPGRPASREFLARAREGWHVDSDVELEPRVEVHLLRPPLGVPLRA
jgi:predicted nicotinamide N-methyase